MSSAFSNVIAAAEQREAEQAKLQEEQRREAREAAKRNAAQRQVEELRSFGNGFLEAVASRVVKADWKPEYIRKIQAFLEALLHPSDVELPQITQQHQKAILDKFAFGLELAERRGIHIPADFFYGQRLLVERLANEKSQQKRIVIQPGARPKTRPVAPVTKSNVVELKPAMTPKKKRGPKTA